MSIHTSYLGRVYNVSQFAKVVEKAIVLAKQALQETKFDTIAFTGTSGAALAYILSNELHVPLICIRKKDDGSHFQEWCNGRLEGNMAVKRYLIVDDFICGGNTIRDIKDVINSSTKVKAVCVSILLYDYGRSHRSEIDGIPVYSSKENENYEQRSLPFPYQFT